MKTCVLLPVYNAGAPLREAIESILAQDERDFEFLIIDDCSRDGSAELIRTYAARDARIRAVFHARNLGLAATLNEGLNAASTEFVIRMDQDDIALPDRISTQLRFMKTRPEVAVAGSFVYHMGRTPAYDRLVRLPEEHEQIVGMLGNGNCIYHPSVILRREPILALSGYRPEYKNAEDYDLWLRAGRVYRLANIPVALLRYRFSTTGMSLGKKWEQALFSQMASISHLNSGWEHEQVRAEAAARLERMGKAWFLEQVARGTIKELLLLGHRADAVRILWSFSRQLEYQRMVVVARDFAYHCLAAKPRTYEIQ